MTTSDGTVDSNNDGSIDAHDVGFFSFVDLHPGVYVVTELFTDGTDWGATIDHNDLDTLGDNITTVTVGSGDELVSQDGLADLIAGQQPVPFGNFPTETYRARPRLSSAMQVARSTARL